MSVRFYQFGALVGGTDSSGSAITPDGGGGGVSGTPEQFSGTLAAATTITFSKTTLGIDLRNTHDSASLEYSYDNVTWFTCNSYQVIQEGAQIDFIYLRPLVGAPTFELVGLLKP